MAVHRWQALTTVEFSALPCSKMVAVLLLGATEQHGPHLLAAQPDLVRPGPYTGIGADYRRGRMAERFSRYRFLSPEGGRVQVGWESTDLTADGVIGDPAGAPPSAGAASLEQMVDQVASMLREIAQFPG